MILTRSSEIDRYHCAHLVWRHQRGDARYVWFRQMAGGVGQTTRFGIYPGDAGRARWLARRVVGHESVPSQNRQVDFQAQVCARADSLCRGNLGMVALALTDSVAFHHAPGVRDVAEWKLFLNE